MQSKKAIIIGSGIGGMATAIRLAVKGFEVSVYEKNNYPGGKLSGFEKEGYHFDTGPSLFTQPQSIEELFVLANEPMETYFSYQPVTIACRYFFSNGSILDAYTNPVLFAEEMKGKLKESPESVTRYLQHAKKLYNNIGEVFLNNSLHKRKTWLHRRTFKALLAVRFTYLFKTLHQYNKSKFRSPEAIQLFDRFATYNGSNPYSAPGMLSMIPHLEHNIGTFFPAGGMIGITTALYKLALKKGVKFYFDSPIERIIQHEQNVKGVVIQKKNIMADIVVSNADVYFTYKNLLSNNNRANKVLKQERSSSAIVFYWGIKKQFPSLQLHNIFFSGNYQAEFNKLFSQAEVFSDPTIYVNITAKMETGLSPNGKENWFVMINVPANTGQDWVLLKENLRMVVIKKLSLILGEDIDSLIEVEHSLDPLLIEEQTSAFGGSIYGSSSNSKWAAFLRHPNFTSTIKGLYFCGGTVHPGGGIPLCLKSAKIVSEIIEVDMQKIKQQHASD